MIDDLADKIEVHYVSHDEGKAREAIVAFVDLFLSARRNRLARAARGHVLDGPAGKTCAAPLTASRDVVE